MVFVLLGIHNSALISYVPAVVAYPESAVSVKFLPCCVWFWAKVVASRLVCGTAILKTPVRAEMVTGTLMFMHVLAAAEPASTNAARVDLVTMFTVIRAPRFNVQKRVSAQSMADKCCLRLLEGRGRWTVEVVDE